MPHNNVQVVGSPYNVGTGQNGYPVGDGYTMARLFESELDRNDWRRENDTHWNVWRVEIKIEGPHGIYTKQ